MLVDTFCPCSLMNISWYFYGLVFLYRLRISCWISGGGCGVIFLDVHCRNYYLGILSFSTFRVGQMYKGMM